MSKALALIGDWNCQATETGKWTTAWLAAESGLRIHSAGPGAHGDIDYALTDCHTGRMVRHQQPPSSSLSDHDPVSMVVANPADSGSTLLLATWNLEYGRPPIMVKRQVGSVLHHLRPDVLALQESADYHPELRAISSAAGYRMLAYSGHGKEHQVLLVRGGLATARPKLVQLSPFGWPLSDGTGSHAPLYATSWVVEWLRVVDLHMPPSVRWPRQLPVGPPAKVAAYVAGIRKLGGWARANRHHGSLSP